MKNYARKRTVVKSIKKADNQATKKIDKTQNKVLMSLNKKVNMLVKRPELKYLYSYLPWNQTDLGNTAPALVGNIYYNGYLFDSCLNLSQGTDYNQRIGDVIRIKFTNFKYTIGFPTPVIDTSGNLQTPYGGYTGAVRVCLIQDTDQLNDFSTTTVPALQDIFNNGYTNGGTLTPMNQLFKDRFKLLYSKVHLLDGINKFVVHGSVNLRHNIKVTYNGSTNTIQSAGKNHIYIVAFSDIVYQSPAITMPSMSYSCSHAFEDC